MQRICVAIPDSETRPFLMTRAAWAWAGAVSCLLIAGNGCSHPAPYGPNYGYPTYPAAPGAYPAAPGAYPAAPGGSYVVPGGSVPGGTLGAPSSSYPSGPGPTLAPPINGGSSGGSAPPYTFDPNSPSPSVPNYEDPTTGDFGTDPSVPDDGFRSPQGDGAVQAPSIRAAVPSHNGTTRRWHSRLHPLRVPTTWPESISTTHRKK